MLPVGFAITADEGVLEIRSASVEWVARSFVALLASEGESVEEGLTLGAYNALSAVQDYVSEVTHDPWPKAPRPKEFAQPNVILDDFTLRLSFVAGASRVLELPPIRMSHRLD